MSKSIEDYFKINTFCGEYFNEYKGWKFSVGIDIFGYQNLAIVMPEGIDIHDFLAPSTNKRSKQMDDDSKVSKETWFTRMVEDVLNTVNMSVIGEDYDGPQRILFKGVGMNMSPHAKTILLIPKSDFDFAEKRFANVLNKRDDLRKTFEESKNVHAKLESMYLDGVSILHGDCGEREIIQLTQKDVIEMAKRFIDRLSCHVDGSIKHKKFLNHFSKIYLKTINERKLRNGRK